MALFKFKNICGLRQVLRIPNKNLICIYCSLQQAVSFFSQIFLDHEVVNMLCFLQAFFQCSVIMLCKNNKQNV